MSVQANDVAANDYIAANEPSDDGSQWGEWDTLGKKRKAVNDSDDEDRLRQTARTSLAMQESLKRAPWRK